MIDDSNHNFNYNEEMHELERAAYFAEKQLVRLKPNMLFATLFRIGVIGGLFFFINTEQLVPRLFLYAFAVFVYLEAMELAKYYLKLRRVSFLD